MVKVRHVKGKKEEGEKLTDEEEKNHKIAYIINGEVCIHIQQPKGAKTEPRTRRCIYVGVDEETIGGYRIYDLQTRKIIVMESTTT